MNKQIKHFFLLSVLFTALIYITPAIADFSLILALAFGIACLTGMATCTLIGGLTKVQNGLAESEKETKKRGKINGKCN